MSLSYANPTSGPSAGGIGWFNFENLSMNPGDTVTGLTGTLSNGNVVTFDMSLTLLSGTPRTFNATSVPTYPLAQFGSAGYTGIPGNVAMYAGQDDGNVADSLFTISNISVKTPGNIPVPNYSVLIADTEVTNLFEGITGQTDGESWELFTVVGAGNAPTLSGTGSQTFNIVGNQQFGAQVAYVLKTQAPGQILLTLIDQDPIQTRQGFAIGFATTNIKLQKNIGQRIDPSDQFVLNITGNPTNQVATTGSANGIQAEFAEAYVSPGNTYRLNEVMAFGSASSLSDYTLTVTVANATPAGSVPPVTALPIQFTTALGDDVTYTFINAAPEVFKKTVDKAYADLGDVLTYAITVENPNDFAINNVLVTDATPVGTTYLGNIVASVAYTGTDLATGITFPVIPANTTAVISWQVQVNTVPPISNPVPNYANITIPGGTTGMTNVVTTQVNTAFVSMLKTVDKAYAQPGEVLTYTLTLKNAGNVSADNVVLTDVIPAGTTFIAGSLVGATGTLPTLTLANPIPAGGIAVVTFNVLIGSTLPTPNPLKNRVTAAFTYTVDPAQPNAVTGTASGGPVSTQVNTAKLVLIKSVDKSISHIGDTVTYQISVKNTGNIAVDNVVLTDPLPPGVSYVAGTLIVSVPYSGTLASGLALTGPIPAGGIITLSFKVKVDTMPNPNPILNRMTAAYTYTVDPAIPDAVSATGASNTVSTIVFRYNFSQQITDLIKSVALEQAALAAIAQAEGAKIQKMVAMSDVTTQELLCLNKSVSDMTDSITMLEAILKQKLGIVNCQINGTGSCM